MKHGNFHCSVYWRVLVEDPSAIQRGCSRVEGNTSTGGFETWGIPKSPWVSILSHGLIPSNLDDFGIPPWLENLAMAVMIHNHSYRCAWKPCIPPWVCHHFPCVTGHFFMGVAHFFVTYLNYPWFNHHGIADPIIICFYLYIYIHISYIYNHYYIYICIYIYTYTHIMLHVKVLFFFWAVFHSPRMKPKPKVPAKMPRSCSRRNRVMSPK